VEYWNHYLQRQAAALCLRENKNEITLSHINKILVEDNILISLKVNMTTEKNRLEEKLKVKTEPLVSTNIIRVDTETKLEALLKESFETNEKLITDNTQPAPVETEVLPQTPTIDQTSQESIIEKHIEITRVEPVERLKGIELEQLDKFVDIPFRSFRKKITFKSLLYSKPYDYENILLVMFASLGIFVIESLCREYRYDVYM